MTFNRNYNLKKLIVWPNFFINIKYKIYNDNLKYLFKYMLTLIWITKIWTREWIILN
jgi:hypothetical protein